MSPAEKPPPNDPEPRRFLLFSGHMIDAPNRPEPRFPPSLERGAAFAIRAKLAELEAGPGDLALSSGACGGDLLFAEACRDRRVPHDLRLPFEEARFLATSVAFADADWVARFEAAKRYAGDRFRIASRELGEAPAGVGPYARTNRWLLDSALARGSDRLDFIALWDGESGEGRGGTSQMVEAVARSSGRIHVIDLRRLLEEAVG